jgi:uncharacterized protein
MNQRSFVPLGVGLVVATLVAAVAFTHVKTRNNAVIDVTGSAKRRIVSDLIEWTASISVENKDRVAAYRTLKGHIEETIAYLKGQGITDAEMRTSSATTNHITATDYLMVDGERVEREVDRGFSAEQSVIVSSVDVKKIERISREVTQLLEKGVPVTSSQPSYLYTKLGELKVEMLAEASKDARVRAERIIAAAGGSSSLGTLAQVDMGVINVNAANSTETSWQGNNDTSSLDKDIITIVHIRYHIKD